MSHLVFCKKLGKEAPGLDSPPYPGEIGQRIYDNISAQVWLAWINQQTMLINEYRLNLTEKKSRQFLEQEMEKFLFGPNDDGKGAQPPPGYVPENDADKNVQ